MATNRDAIFGELLYFINSPMFQIPVKTFMDENCVSKLFTEILLIDLSCVSFITQT